MTFTLRDPRLEAFSNIGGNLGKSLGDEIISMVENRRFNKSLQGSDPNDLLGMLQKFSQNRVSSENQERFFSPVIQNRLSQQKVSDVLKSTLGKEGLTQKDIGAALVEILPYIQPGTDLKSILDVFRGGQVPEGLNKFRQGFSRQSPMPEKSMQPNNIQGEPIGDPISNSFSEVQQGSLGDTSVRDQFPVQPNTQPYSEKEILDMQQSAFNTYGPETGQKIIDTLVNSRNTQIANEIRKMEFQDRSNEKIENKQDKIRSEIDSFLARDYGDIYEKNPEGQVVPRAGAPTFLQDMVKDLSLKEKGLPEDKYNSVKNKYIEPITEGFRTIKEKLPSAPYFDPLEGEEMQKWLSLAQDESNKILNSTPKNYKKAAADSLRTTFRNNFIGVGPVGSEWAIFPPSQEMISDFKSLGRAPSLQTLKNTSGLSFYEKNPQFDKSNKIVETKLVSLIPKWAKKGMSPIIMKDFVVSLGYEDETFDRALSKAEKNGLKWSPEMDAARNDTKKAFQATPMKFLQGNTLRGLGEISR